MGTPRLQVDLNKIHRNAGRLVELLGEKGITVTGVTKVALGSPEVARTMVTAGVEYIGDSRIENIRRMREAGVSATFVLLRSPQMSSAAQVVQYADISHNTELTVVAELSRAAQEQGKIHQVVLMIELGDLREGIMPRDLANTVRELIGMAGVRLSGIGTNLACFGGVSPDVHKMQELSDLAQSLETEFDITLDTVSGGNSANFDWLSGSADPGRINNLRLGESILLGCETLRRTPIEGLHTDAIVLVAEVIESKIKPSVPSGKIFQDAFGAVPEFTDRGLINHAILGIGRQDVLVSGLTPLAEGLEIFGASSDHIVVISNEERLGVGDEVSFRLSYGALLAAMTSPFVEKIYTNTQGNM
ncbi:MAG: alanine/ornithine racemase family PLP-dependent enzyme [Gemmatimonadota bacterium]|nr:alanine/ornithine racemase family PLP-dependent enzyme [Gemmatimonadota bacterium]